MVKNYKFLLTMCNNVTMSSIQECYKASLSNVVKGYSLAFEIF